MKIAIVDTLGLTYDGTTLTKRGLGGSESAVILLSRELAKIGFEVTVFNDCTSDDSVPGFYNQVQYLPVSLLQTNDFYFDIVIGSRSVKAFTEFHKLKSRFSALWLHDTFCEGDHLVQDLVLNQRINEIFTLSDFHTSYIGTCDHGQKRMFESLKKYIYQTRNGMTLYTDEVDILAKDPNLFVYNASVTKGMVVLVDKVWPALKQRIPEAKLKIIGGFYRFRSDREPDAQEVKWRELVANNPDIEFTGIITQKEISEVLSKASFTLYPTGFPETFGISTMESIAYNTPIITTSFGALEETAFDAVAYKIPLCVEPNNLFPYINEDLQVEHFVQLAYNAWNDKYLHQQKMYACNEIKDICGWDSVAKQWKQHFYYKLKEYLPIDEYHEVSKINCKVHRVFGRRFINPEEIVEPRIPLYNIINVIVPAYNASQYIGKCIRSIASQDYNNYNVTIIDDASTDNTAEEVERVLNSLPEYIRKKFKLVVNQINMGAVYNQINTAEGKDGIIALVDGDDWLVNKPDIFTKINNLYNLGVDFTYGSCYSIADNIPLVAQPYPKAVIEAKSFRSHKFNWNMPYTHLRTFKSDLLLEVIEEKGYWPFKDGDNWLRAGGDTAIFYEIIEKATNIKCIQEILYNYNDLNPINDYKVNGEEQTRTANKVLGKEIMPAANKKILIAIPCKNDIEADTFKSVYDLIIPPGYEADFQYFYGYAVDQVRNLIASWVVNGYDYLFAVDHDIVFGPDTLAKLLSHDRDIVCGVYRQRVEEQILEIYDMNLVNYRTLPSSGLHEIGGCGFGCTLVKREVLAHVGYPQFVYHQALDHKNTFSEDLDFCKKARERGFRIFADTSITCGHIGSKTLTIARNTVEERLRELHDMPLLPQDHIDYLRKISFFTTPEVVYDIGACVLHWTNEAKKIWPNARYIAFEAMDAVGSLYKERGIDYCIGHPLFSEDYVEMDFYENVEHPGGNSLFEENAEFSPRARELFEGRQVKRTTRKLDTLVRDLNIPLPDLIKIDAQGAELDILKGATETLKHCKDIIIELQHVDYNKGAPKYQEVTAYLNSLGFENSGQMFCGSALGVDGDYHFTRVR